MADQTQRLEIATVKAEIGSDILSRFSNDAVVADPIPTDSGDIQNLKQVIATIQDDGAEKISFATTIYPTTAAGIAATTDGAIFLVKSVETDEIYAVWQNVAGVATDTGKRALSAQAIEDSMVATDASADAAAASASSASANSARFLNPSATAPTVRDNGSPLQDGDQYQNTTNSLSYSRVGGAWVALNQSVQQLDGDLSSATDPIKGPAMIGVGTPNVYVLAQPGTLAWYAGNWAYRVEGHMTPSEWTDFITGTGTLDHSVAFGLALAACAANRSIKHVVFGSGSYNFPDVAPVEVPAAVSLIGAGISSSVIKKAGAQFVFNMNTLGLVQNVAELAHCQIQAKNCIYNRFLPGSDYVNLANPTRSSNLHDLKLVGTYNATSDPLAGGSVVPTRAELEALGVGINSVMQYGAFRERVCFDNFGIALASIGDTLCRNISNRFNNNARHIHDERTAWYGSSFGMGADNVYENNDILDGRRVGGVTFVNSYGAKFLGNYLEHLNRGGANSAPECVMQVNTSRVSIARNHINPTLSSTSGRPFYLFSADAAVQPDTGGNVTEQNYYTPSSTSGAASVNIAAGFNVKAPNALLYRDNTGWPIVRTPNVMTSSPGLDKFNALAVPNDTIGGALSTSTDLWVSNGVGGSYVKTVNSPLVIYLTAENPNLSGKFSLIFDVDDLAASGNGRMFVTVTDSDGTTVLYSANAYAGVVAPSKVYLTLTSAILESRKRLKIECGNFSLSKVYGIRLEPMQLGFATATAINPASIAVGASETAERTFTIAGAEVGDDVKATFSLDTKGLTIPARISAANTVAYYFHNPAGNPNGTQDLGSGSVYFQLIKRRV